MRSTYAVTLLFLAGCSSPTLGTRTSALSYPNDQPAFDYFVGKGLPSFQAAGIVGNLDVESGVDPTSVQSGGPGRGIAQWSAGARWDTTPDDNAVWYASQQGESVDSLPLQLAFIWYELQTFPEYGFGALSASTNVTDATLAFMTDFEGCGSCNQSLRIADAMSVLATNGVDGGAVPTGPSCTIPSGAIGECIDTSECTAMPDHVSTPGYCPGAANIECCTSTIAPTDGSTALDGGMATKHGGGCDATGSASGDARGAASASLGAIVVLWLLRRRRVA